MSDMVTSEEWEAINERRCPDCGDDLRPVARGGMARNYECRNGHRFWTGSPVPTIWPPERLTPKPLDLKGAGRG